jgi:hypothetical protein
VTERNASEANDRAVKTTRNQKTSDALHRIWEEMSFMDQRICQRKGFA